MTKTLHYILPLSLAILSLLPAVSSAHAPNILTGGYWGPFVTCTAPITLPLPPAGTPQGTTACKSLCDLIHTLIHVIAFGMSLTLYAAAPILFAWGGILILISSGNPGKISEGKKVLTGTLIGVLIILSAYLIVKTLIDTLGITLIPTGFQCVVQ